MPPCVLFEDEHLLVVNKPAGWNTHAPAPLAGEGLYDWLKHREPRWARLAIVHRLDKETSGVLVFGKTPLANRSLTEQFAAHAVRKIYLLVTDRPLRRSTWRVQSGICRAGERYVSNPRGEPAVTRFEVVPWTRDVGEPAQFPPGCTLVRAEPVTGRTHQVRVHAAGGGVPVLGDVLYGGTPFPRVCLHAAEIAFRHPATHEPVSFRAPVDFTADARVALRQAFIEPEETNAYRLLHGAGDGQAGAYLDRLSDYLLWQWKPEAGAASREEAASWAERLGSRGVYHRPLRRAPSEGSVSEVTPELLLGEPAPERFVIRENGVRFELSFHAGGAVGLFLDQRDNRRRLLTGHVAAGFELWSPGAQASGREVLNTFAYTCGFSVCAALAGARATSLDLSRRWLEWGRRNFAINGLDANAHEFVHGDVFDRLKWLAKRGRAFDVVLLDPPTFSRSKVSGTFRAERDYGRRVAAALRLLKPDGVLFASTNAAGWAAEAFLQTVRAAVRAAGRWVAQEHYAPQPPDFPVSRAEPAHLKTVWLRVR
ncbi:MAG: class I SAM-dependent methyltransferase [Verrucomicrobiales bacterium]|nr:class I SAM-dependent methyltransferase [Verrucomicrobiales bacterium]